MVTCGFFGKLPSRGDFVSRHLSHGLTQALDRWLQDTLAICMDTDEDWEERFQASPCWRFALGLTGTPGGLVGVLRPSQDRVGRAFPLVLAQPLATAPGLTFPEDWSMAYERLAILAGEAVDTPLQPDDLEHQLHKLPAPPAPRGGPIPAMQPGLRLNLHGNSVARTLAAFPHSSRLHSGSLWWHHGTEYQPPCVLVSAGYPAPHAARHLWSRDWQNASWRRIGS